MQTECIEGEQRCNADGLPQACDATGTWIDAEACTADLSCVLGECLTECEALVTAPSSLGCSFHLNNMYTLYDTALPGIPLPGGGEPDGHGAAIVGNPTDAAAIDVSLFQYQPDGAQLLVEGPVTIAAGQSHSFELVEPWIRNSAVRQGGSYRLESTAPVVAYQHSPTVAQYDNDSSLLIPDHVLGNSFVIASYPQNINNAPPYFNVVATVDGTEVTWVPPVGTAGSDSVPPVTAGATGTVTLNAGDTLQVNGQGDLSGTLVNTTQPVWVIGANRCAEVPSGVSACDHLEEQSLPVHFWGEQYVAAHAPTRGGESYRWRIFAGGDNIQVTTTPVQPGTPATLSRGEFVEINATQSFVIDATGPVLPMQYLASQEAGAGTGDPAMLQAVPVAQFLDRYAFTTGEDYQVHYAQITRPLDGPDVLIDGVVVEGYEAVGAFEVADWTISEGPHFAQSTATFGIAVVGYTGFTSYAYPGGLALEVIAPG